MVKADMSEASCAAWFYSKRHSAAFILLLTPESVSFGTWNFHKSSSEDA